MIVAKMAVSSCMLEALIVIGQRFPFLQAEAKEAEETRDKISELRREIKREAARRGVNG